MASAQSTTSRTAGRAVDGKGKAPRAGGKAAAPKACPELMAMDDLGRAAECLKILAHPVRLRIVDILLQGQVPVGRIAELCGLPSHQASEHLRMLKGLGLLGSRRDGRTVYYHVADPRLPRLLACIRMTCSLE